MRTFLKVVLVIWIFGSTGYYLCKINHHCSKAPTPKIVHKTVKTLPEQKEPVQEEKVSVTPIDTITPELERIRNAIGAAPNFYFNTNSTNPDSFAKIDNLATDLSFYLSNKPNSKIQLVGHTDFTGSSAFNYNLGLKRAEEFKKIIVKRGVDKNRINIDSKGEEEPIADNKTKEGRRKNRRVEIHIIH